MSGSHPTIGCAVTRTLSGVVCLILACSGPVSAQTGKGEANDLTLQGGQSGTVFRSLTVEGENRIRIEIARPRLHLDLDPRTAPGLDLRSVRHALDYDRPNLLQAFHAQVAAQSSPYTARPWLDGFATGPVARFHPDVTDVERWRLVVADSRGREVATFEGDRRPKEEIVWDGRAADGSMALPGLTYTYVFQAQDRAGNRRNFVGEGFAVPAYRRLTENGAWFVFSGQSPGLAGTSGTMQGLRPTSPILVEVASRLHQSTPSSTPVRVRVVARRYDDGDALARSIAAGLAPLLMGDASRILQTVDVEADAPAGGTVIISTES